MGRYGYIQHNTQYLREIHAFEELAYDRYTAEHHIRRARRKRRGNERGWGVDAKVFQCSVSVNMRVEPAH